MVDTVADKAPPVNINGLNESQIQTLYDRNFAMYQKYINNKDIESMPYSVKELNTVVYNNYILLIVWFIILLFVILITIFTLLDETAMNKYGLFLIIIFLFYIFFYFITSIFKII